jgi:3-hydroxyisobutyrate dehydrogenase-like beta-hydroxyacid dehydrogenase
MIMKLGFIGLGNLGMPIAENILTNTKQLFIFNRTKSRTQPLVEKGAVLCHSVKELASLCDVVFSVVSNDEALEEITKGNEGIAVNLKVEGIHISISTILPATARALSGLHQQYKNYYLASPVIGRPETARAGKLNFLVSGDKAIIEKAETILLHAGAAGVWEFGEKAEAANVAKLCSNFLIAAAIESMAEGIHLAKKSSLDAEAWMSMLTQTLFNSPIYMNYSAILLKEAFQPAAFSLRLGLKDVNLVLEQASTVQAKMPFGRVIHKQFTDSIENGLAEYDWTSVALALK